MERKGKVVNNLTVTKDNELINACFSLTLDEHRLILFAISMLRMNVRGEWGRSIEVVASEFADCFGIDHKNVYQQLKKLKAKLLVRSVRVINKETGLNWDIQWVSAVAYHDRKGFIVLSFSEEIMNYLVNLKKAFTNYRLSDIGQFKSCFSLRLFELLKRFDSTGWWTVEVPKLKECLGLVDKYPEFKNFRRRVIEIAVNELNQSKFVSINEVQYIKNGKSIVAVKFVFEFFSKKNTLKKIEKKNLGIVYDKSPTNGKTLPLEI